MHLRFLLPLFALTALGACASDQPAPEPDHHHHHRDGGPAPDGATAAAAGAPARGGGLFISPMGQPFHAPPGQPYPSAIWFQTANTTHDGRLTRAQFRADAEAFFRTLDQNHDGVIDASEISAYEHAVPEIIEGFRPNQGEAPAGSGQGSGGGHHGHHGGGMGSGGHGGGGSHAQSQAADSKPQGAAWFSFLNIPEPVASADRDLDGKVTLEEFLETADARFDELDPDHNGYLTFDKLPKTPVQTTGRH